MLICDGWIMGMWCWLGCCFFRRTRAGDRASAVWWFRRSWWLFLIWMVVWWVIEGRCFWVCLNCWWCGVRIWECCCRCCDEGWRKSFRLVGIRMSVVRRVCFWKICIDIGVGMCFLLCLYCLLWLLCCMLIVWCFICCYWLIFLTRVDSSARARFLFRRVRLWM